MIAIVFVMRPSRKSGIIEIFGKSGRIRGLSLASLVGAALVDEEADERMHDVIIRPADQCAALPFLHDQACMDKRLQVKGKGRGCDLKAMLAFPN
jgi:hypothetical protein